MAYKIVVDSCCDLTQDMKSWSNLSVIPMTLQIGDYVVSDDENFDQNDFISRMVASKVLAKSACPSPEAFAKACEGDEEDVYLMTITDKLSGCYNSAVQGVQLFKDEHPDSGKNIHVFNSLATSGLETLMAYKIKELADGGASFDDIVSAVEDYCVNGCGLYFCLESMDALKGNGRLYNVGAKIIETLHVKLIGHRTDYGNISIAGKDFTTNRILSKTAALIAKDTQGSDLSGKTVIISHVCCEEKAKRFAEMVKEKNGFSNVVILKCSGLNSLYASNEGIIVSFEK